MWTRVLDGQYVHHHQKKGDGMYGRYDRKTIIDMVNGKEPTRVDRRVKKELEL